MELRHLRYFVAVAEQGNVSRAARKLFIAQPPLSQQLKQLEDEVGTQLFTRLPRGMQLTAAGESLLEDARAILARAEQAPLRARTRAQQPDRAAPGAGSLGHAVTAARLAASCGKGRL